MSFKGYHAWQRWMMELMSTLLFVKRVILQNQDNIFKLLSSFSYLNFNIWFHCCFWVATSGCKFGLIVADLPEGLSLLNMFSTPATNPPCKDHVKAIFF